MGLFENMQQRGIWRGYSRQIVGLEPILFDMSLRGMPVSAAAYAATEAQLAAAMALAEKEMQALIPSDIRRYKEYKRKPRKEIPWKPSNKGLLAYIRHKGHRIPKNFKTGKETTEALEIKRLEKETHDPLYRKVLEYRKAGTVLDNHIENWRPSADGRVHSTFYFDPATGQLSSRRPNVQNAPKHDDPEYGGYAKIFRGMIQASPGHTLMEFDFKSFHAQTLAFEAEDVDYLRVAKLDIHSYLTAHLVHDPESARCLSYDDEKLAAYLSSIKRRHKFVRDYKAKRAILGYGFGMGWKKLYELNRESFDSQSDAKSTIAMLNGIFPTANQWRDDIRYRAHTQGYLLSRHGYIRYFWEVMTWKGGAWYNGGEDSEAAIAFLPANDAFGEIRDRMVELREKGLDSRYNLINNIHDSLLFEVPNALVDEAARTVKEIMERPSSVLQNRICPDGLSVEVDIQVGPTWGDMKAYERTPDIVLRH